MLKIWLGRYTEKYVTIDKPDSYFDFYFDKRNFLTDFSRRLIRDCAKAEVITENIFEHEYRGTHTASCLATGVKTILLAKYNPNVITNLVYCGDNCIPYLMEASREQDITVSSSRLVDFWDYDLYGDTLDSVFVMNNGKLCKRDREYFHYYGKYRYDWNENVNGKVILHKDYYRGGN